MPRPWKRLLVCISVAAVNSIAVAWAASPTADQTRFFEERVRPILAMKCQRCHGESKQKGGLRLDSRAAVLTGGDSGAAVEPGQPTQSLLIGAINYESYEMPPDGKLPDDEIAILTRWVQMGAPWPEDKSKGVVRDKGGQITDDDRAYWAFQPVRTVPIPTVDDHGWTGNAIDAFIFQRLAAAGLSPRPAASRAQVGRRLYFDLVGLPPSPQDIQAFVADESPQAFDQLVERLLDSEHYGEKWARHWLDLVRYAESDGFKQDAYRTNSWPYRDYVVHSFNADKPYDQFIREQLAGDELEPSLETLSATAYLRHWIYEYNQRDVRTQWSNILNDITDVTAEVFLGLSVGCARCHDHKFDPILRKDYYRLQAFFGPLLPRDDVPLATAPEAQEYSTRLVEWQQRTAEVREALQQLEQPIRKSTADGAINKFPPDIRPLLRKPAAERTPFEHQLAEMAGRQITEEYSKLDFKTKLKGDARDKWIALKKQLDEFQKSKPVPLPLALTVTDVGRESPVTTIPGDKSRQPIAPGFLTVLAPGDVTVEPPVSGHSTGRRTALANWIASPDNPLTARVIVNRVWQHHFGQGIVGTSSDFGHLGEIPSHPELLDWLAKWFVDNGWSLKKLHRLIVTSATYRQSSAVGEVANSSVSPMTVDPENRLLWHMPVRRLEAEQIRDAALAVSGELKLTMGGPSVDASQPRRTIYTKVIRNDRDLLLDVFDSPDNFNSTATRNVTTTPTQALLMINGPWMLRRAEALANRLEKEAPADFAPLIERAFLLAFGRLPASDELTQASRYLSERTEKGDESRATDFGVNLAPFPGHSAMALDIQGDQQPGLVYAPDSPTLPQADFTVEAYVMLRSLYEDSAVRTIAAHWDSDTKHPGWSFGVSSKRSRFEPRNLILQMVGATKDGSSAYEVIASNLRMELNRPYYVAVRLKIADVSDQGVTFFLRDLSDDNLPLQTASVPHKVVKDYHNRGGIVLGGREGKEARHRWDGLLDDVRLSSTSLPTDHLLLNSESSAVINDQVAAYWRFDRDGGVLHDTSPRNNHLSHQSIDPAPSSPRHAALVDFGHVLLNSNEFLYID